MIELRQFAGGPWVMNLSRFCMKVEVFLRLSGLPHRGIDGALPMRTPKGKLPVVHDDARVVADSAAIVEYLQQRYGARMPPALAAPETPAHLLLRRLIEDHLYFVVLWQRWIDAAGWALTRPAFFGGLPFGVRRVVPALVRRKIGRDLRGQGVSRHARDEIHAQGVADISALAARLGEAAFYGGSEPAAIDATVYAFIANIIDVPLDSPVRAAALAEPSLMGYAARMKARVGT
jgi:glutathione S-transferase